MKETYTREEVVRLLRILYSQKIYNPLLQDGDKELLESIGFQYGCVENGHGGYCSVSLTAAGHKEILGK